MDADQPHAQAVAVSGHTITAVGRDDEVLALASAHTRLIDAQGATLLPGFVESHLHLFSGGAGLTLLQLAKVSGVEALTRAVRHYADRNPDEGLLICQGASYDILGDLGRMTRQHLDMILPDRPLVLMAFDFHTAWANTIALDWAGLLQGRDPGVGNEVVMGADGLASGELREKYAFLPVLDLRTSGGREMLGMSGVDPSPAPTAKERADDKQMILAGLRHCAAAGITSVHNMDGNRYTLDLLREIEEAGDLLCRVEVPFHLTAEKPLAELEEASALARDFQSDMLSSGRVKIFAMG